MHRLGIGNGPASICIICSARCTPQPMRLVSGPAFIYPSSQYQPGGTRACLSRPPRARFGGARGHAARPRGQPGLQSAGEPKTRTPRRRQRRYLGWITAVPIGQSGTGPSPPVRFSLIFLRAAMALQAGLRATGWCSTNATRRIACSLLEQSHTRTASPSGEVFNRRFLAPAMRLMSQRRGRPFRFMTYKESMSWLVVIKTLSEGYRRINGMPHEFSWKTCHIHASSRVRLVFKPCANMEFSCQYASKHGSRAMRPQFGPQIIQL